MKQRLLNQQFVSGAVIVFLTCFGVGNASGAGFEKVVDWSGKAAGLAGAGVSNSTGAESLYFNPAGLAAGKGGEVSLNFSPTFAQYAGPFATPNVSLDSARKLSPVFGALVSYKLTEQLGVGFGAYVSGGTKAIYENVDFGTAFPALKPTVQSDLAIYEYALGAAYEIIPGWKFGAAWRIVNVKANLSTVVPGNPLVALSLDNLSATRYNGFKVGTQYVGNGWGVGAAYRTEVDFTAKGTESGKANPALATTAIDLPGGDAEVSNIFPMQATLAGYYDLMPKVRLLTEYAWTQYTKNQALTISGPVSGTIAQNWQNMTNVRFGAECTALQDWAFRAGYAYTSEVTPKSSARPTFSSPGSANTFTVGAGKYFFDGKVDADLALEYSTASGTVTDQGSTPGEYKTNAYDLHAGVNYRF